MATAVDPNLLFFVTLDILLNKQSKNQLNTSIHWVFTLIHSVSSCLHHIR